MEIAPLTKEKYKEWDAFCKESDDAWFWHTTGWLLFMLDYKPEIKKQNLSFFVFDKEILLAVCPLMLETNEGISQFSLAGDYGQIPALKRGLNDSVRNQIFKFIFEHIDNLAKKHNAKRILMRFPVLTTPMATSNILTKFGFLDASLATQVVDMRIPFQELKKNLRHGHASDITKATKILTGHIFDSSSITKEIFEEYIKLHFKASGRVTRPRSTFDKMFDFIKEGSGFLVGAQKDGIYIGFSYFYLYKNSVYYGSACNDPEYGNIPIAHFIQWKAIEWMHNKKCVLYEIGWQHYGPTLLGTPSEKEINIDRFKRGFGGDACTLFRGEKYYDKEFFLDTYGKRVQEFAKNI
jgi:hypothetical protein